MEKLMCKHGVYASDCENGCRGTISVEQIKALLPSAEVYRLDPAAKHIILMEPMRCPQQLIQHFSDWCKEAGLAVIILVVGDANNSVKILELNSKQQEVR